MHTTRRSLLAAGAGSASLLGAPGILRAQGATLRLSHQYPPAHHIAKVLADFAEEVNACFSGGIASSGLCSASRALPRPRSASRLRPSTSSAAEKASDAWSGRCISIKTWPSETRGWTRSGSGKRFRRSSPPG